MKIRNNRRGPLVIADARLRLAPGEVTEVEKASRQMEKALSKGWVEKVDDAAPVGAPKPAQQVPGLPADYQRLSVSEAIEYIDDEQDKAKLKAILGTEKRKTVLEVLRKKLEEVGSGAAQ